METEQTREEGPAEEELSQNTAKGPYVNGLSVWEIQDHFWSSGHWTRLAGQ